MTHIDNTGTDFLIKAVDFYKKSAVLEGEIALAPFFEHHVANQVSLLKDEDQVAIYFARELAKAKGKESAPERRRFIRLDAVLPFHFSFETDDIRRLDLFAVVTNLSEGGLFAEFIESLSEQAVKEGLHPYDPRLLYLKIWLPESECVEMQGKVIHGSPIGGGIGIEFYQPKEENLGRIVDWLDRKYLQMGENSL